MSGSAIERLGHKVVDDRIVHNDRAMSWEEADKRAGFRLDRRKSWAFIPDERDIGLPELCEMISFTRACSGCEDSESMYCTPTGSGCRECGYTGKRRSHCFAPFCRPERIRKAWTIGVARWLEGDSCTGYGPSASKVQAEVRGHLDDVSFADITVRRCKEKDISLPAPDEIALGLTPKERDVLLHAHGSTCGDVMKAGFRDYYYTDQDNPVLCSLVEKGLMRKSDRGWEEGSVYFFTTDAGKHCADSLTPEYNP
ncbi:hypothetical protein [Gluconobacter cerinus]|uniref:hypothetical protein n=1 Tax=Gluconobacter cerinus TaxID=38307 RepID=UPI001C03DBAF|nr:hypothetical protein [Gluconobacter cerinus]